MVSGVTVFGLFNQVQVMVTEALSWEQNNMPPASPWELAWRESLAPSLVVGAFCTYAGRKETPKQDKSVLLRTSSLH